MTVKITSTTEQWSYHVGHQSLTSPKPTSYFSSSTKIRKRDGTLLCKFNLSGTGMSTKFLRSQSVPKPVSNRQTIKRACSANFDGFNDENLFKQIEGLAQSFDLLDEEEIDECTNNKPICTIPETRGSSITTLLLPSNLEIFEPQVFGIMPEPPVWPERESVMRVSIERKANSFDLPLSLRMIKKKQKLQEGFRGGLGDSASCCSLNKAFSSMVFIILELQKFYTLEMRQVQCFGDLEGIIARVHREMHESFAWLFQQIFSQTPNLMVYVMILIANFSVHNISIQEHELQAKSRSYEMTEIASLSDTHSLEESKCDSWAMKSLSVSDNNGGDSYIGRSSLSVQYPDDDLSLFSLNEDQKINEEEMGLWNLLVDEAMRMQMEQRGVVLDHETMRGLTSPVNVEMESDDYTDYFRTNLLYQMELSKEPNNPLLLCNYAQFLFLVARDYNRAEECFKRSIQAKPLDAECLSQYANFLWIVRKDMWGAEERYVQAMAAEPENSFHASKYANFLWNTGGDETCFPLNGSYNTSEPQNL